MRQGGWLYLRSLIVALIVIYTLAPLVIIVILSFSSAQFLTFPPPGLSLQWYERILSSPKWASALKTTALITIPTTIIATVVGTGAAIGIARSKGSSAAFLSAIIMSPLVIPTIIVGAGVFSIFRSWGLAGTYTGMILAHVMLTIPYVFSVTLASLRTVNSNLEGAALTLGASPLRVLLLVTVPMIAPAILSGFLFAAVMSFDELVISMFLNSPTVRPITVQMWADVRGEVDPTIAAIASCLFAFTLILLLADHLVARRRAGTKTY
ncbi:ABC transporter permease [Rhizobium sp. CF142]|uniref:ABC transporter permease n=1 Tax=Rhizobium sp. CF142 TaxID=1144314 RepID=UPI00026EEAEE|nr:ABC transporter permease [Rhizobium sp. CF142]EJJ31494.1 ABC-type spermidine/putrescine transport system, permease component II [Rhizobium sp. CF142]